MSRTNKIQYLWLFYLASDIAAIAAAYFTTFALRFGSGWGQRLFTRINQALGVDRTGALGETLESFYLSSAFRIVLQLSLVLCLLYALFDLYPGRRFIRRRPVAWLVLLSNTCALLLFYAYFYMSRNVWHPRSFFAPLLLINVFYSVWFRGLTDRLLQKLRSRFGFDRCTAVLAGTGEEADRLGLMIEECHPHGIYLGAKIPLPADEPLDRSLRRLRESTESVHADLLILADKNLSIPSIMAVLELADSLNVSVKALSDKMEILQTRARLPVDHFGGVPLVHFEAPPARPVAARVKRVITFVIAWLALIAALPIMGVLALLIRFTSRGDVLFVQERMGVNRKPFRMLKFRTMYDRADEMQAQLEEFNQSGEGLFKIKTDPRVTPVGRFLRRFSLDELPQLINVIRGEMALVGPRPLPRRDFENYYEEWHYSRHGGLPGLTCLWQVSGRSDVAFHDMCLLDVYYLRNHNWILDVKIVIRTIWVVLFARGAY